MRYDLFYDKKSIHVKLSKEQHAALRERLFRFGITMQDLFKEAADMALLEGDKSDKFLQKVAKKKLQETIDKSSKKSYRIGDFDKETLYNLLEEEDGTKNKE